VNTIDSNFFLENIRAGYQQRQERNADKGKEPVEIVSHIYDIIKNSHQILHNRGKALAYLTNKRKEGPHQAQARKAPHQYERVTGLRVMDRQPPREGVMDAFSQQSKRLPPGMASGVYN